MSFYFSFIYPFIKDLKKEKNGLIKDYPIYKMRADDRKYYLMKLKSNQSQSLFDDFQLKDTHFSFDKTYDGRTVDTHGLTPIHFTQTYVSLVDNTERVVHAYLNAKGEYQYTKVKENPESEFPIVLNKDQENKLKANIEEYRPLLDALLKEKDIRRAQFKKEADKLDCELTTLSRTLNDKETREEYLRTARAFIEIIKKFNRYSEFCAKDARDKVILRLFCNIERVHMCGEAEVKAEMPLMVEEGVLEEPGLLPQKDSINELYQLVIDNISQIRSEFKKLVPTDVQSAILKNKLADQLGEQILVFYSFNTNLLKKHHIKNIESLVAEMNAFYHKQNEALKNYVLKEGIEEFKSFFPVVKKYLTQEFYYDLISMLVKNQNVLEVCQYLSENDNQYREAVKKFSEEKRFSFVQDETFISVTKANKIKQYDAPILYKLYAENNFFLFKTLLAHGANPDAEAFKQVGCISPITLFYAIGYLGNLKKIPNHLEYLRLLTQYDVNPNDMYRKPVHLAAAYKKIYDLKHSKKSFNSKGKKNKSFFIEHKTYKPDHPLIEIFAKTGDVESVCLILPKTSLANLGQALGSMMGNTPLLLKTFRLSKHYDIHTRILLEEVLEWDEELKQTEKEILTNIGSKDIFVVSLFALNPNNNFVDNVIAIKMIMHIKMFNNALSEKIPQISFKEFEEEYNNLFKIADEYVLFDSWQEAWDAYVGCEFLLIKRYVLKTDSCVEKMLIQQHLKCLYEKLYIVTYKCFDSDHAHEIMSTRIKSLNSIIGQPLDRGFAVKATHSTSILSVCNAAQNRDIDTLKKLLVTLSKEELDQSPPDCKGWTPLHFACKVGNEFNDFKCAKALIGSGASIDVMNIKDKKPLAFIKDKSTVDELKTLYNNKKLGI